MLKKSTIEEMQEIALEKGGWCLSPEYIKCSIKLKWKCKEGHIFMMTPTHVKEGHWCPKCSIIRNANKNRGNITEMQNIAKSRDGKCLTDKYINNRTNLKWQCSEGHIWECRVDHIKNGRWCPKCTIKRNSEKRKRNVRIRPKP